jgi:hypothetical protein
MMRRLFALWLAVVAIACHTPSPELAPEAGVEASGGYVSTDAGHKLGAYGPSGDGVGHYRAGALQPDAGPVDVRDSRDFYPNLPDASGNGFYVIGLDAGVPYQVQMTQDLINALPAAFSVSLGFASGSGNFEVGATTSPTYNATPATNDSSVTNCTIADNQGHSASAISHANAINVDTPSGPHAYSLSSPGNVTVTVTETKISTGTTKSASASLSFLYRGGWHSVDANASASAATASSNNVTLSGGATATLSGSSLASSWVGTSFTENPVNQYIWMVYPHSSSPTFTAGGFAFPTTVVVSGYSFTNQYSVTGISVDIIRSTNLLNGSFTVLRTL